MPKLQKLKAHWFVLLYFAFWLIYFSVFWARAIFVNSAGDVISTHAILWADWAAHFTMGSAMAYRDLLPKTSPFLVTASFAYPFATNLLSAIFVRLGVSFFAAFLVPSWFLCCATILLLYFFYARLFKIKAVAVLAACIFLLNGGVGFVYFARDIETSPTPLQTFIHPPQKYTSIESAQIEWISVIDSMLIPQRAFTLGFSLGLLSLIVIIDFAKPAKTKQKRSLQLSKVLLAGAIIGLMPIIHTHTFLAFFVILSFWCLPTLLKDKKWFFLAGITGLIAVPLILIFFSNHVSSQGFLQWYPGWYAQQFHTNWLIFWLRNWSITPIMAIVGAYFLYKEKHQNIFTFLPFFVLFILANLFLFQPYIWDNTKILAWVSVGFSGLAAYAVWKIWQKNLATKILASILVFLIIASGSIDTYRIIEQQSNSYTMYSAEEIQLSEWAKTQTDAHSIWLTSDKHNHWLYNLTGRQTVMAYRGWLWSQGYQYQNVEADVTTMFTDPTQTDLFQKYHINYICIGPDEIANWHADPSHLAQFFPTIKHTSNYTIFKVNSK